MNFYILNKSLHTEFLNQTKNVAESEDGIIEAIEFQNNKFAIGVQWHPEDLFETDENMFKI